MIPHNTRRKKLKYLFMAKTKRIKIYNFANTTPNFRVCAQHDALEKNFIIWHILIPGHTNIRET